MNVIADVFEKIVLFSYFGAWIILIPCLIVECVKTLLKKKEGEDSLEFK